MGGRSFINGVPLEDIPEDERKRMFNKMLIRATHLIGYRFEHEEENDPVTYDKRHPGSVRVSAEG